MNQPDIGILLGFNRYLKADAGHHARRREEADIPLQQPIERNLFSLVGDDIGAQKPTFDYEHADAVRRAVMDDSALRDAAKNRCLFQRLLILFGELFPDWQICVESHTVPPKSCLFRLYRVLKNSACFSGIFL
ncbi:hypothetical protein SDC9_170950 [bioreactor metagenome]|uniref:Uncharacterized protein n=1 Tax=bioreactor metagenome TaxID=1076179 RepID=A0A645G9I5_9ZZZZ